MSQTNKIELNFDEEYLNLGDVRSQISKNRKSALP